MPLIEWKQEFNTGIEDIDYDHQELVELINTLYSILLTEPSKLTIGEFLGEIYARISAHFALEEQIMLAQDYDEYQDHKDDHERLLDDIRNIMEEFEDSANFDAEVFSRHLGTWFIDHFKTKDMRFHKHLF